MTPATTSAVANKVLTCPVCGKEFVPKRKDQKYDLKKCRDWAYLRSEKCRARNRAYQKSEKRKAWIRARQKSSKYKAYNRAYQKSEKRKAWIQKYHQSEKRRAQDSASHRGRRQRIRELQLFLDMIAVTTYLEDLHERSNATRQPEPGQLGS